MSSRDKYDWSNIKIEFLTSEYSWVKEFFLSSYEFYTPYIKKKTMWWTEEKKNLLKDIHASAIKSLIDEWKEVYKPSIELISNLHKSIFLILEARIKELMQGISEDENGRISFPSDFNIWEIATIWRIIRTEQWLPIKYNWRKDTTINYTNIESVIFN
jgi:hypothetical protein